MLEILVVSVVLLGLIIWFIKFNTFEIEGQTKGEVTRVEPVESKYVDRRHRHKSSLSYQPYVKYTWEGVEYEAKARTRSAEALYFPRDIVLINVGKKDKNVVDIVEILGRNNEE